MADEFTEDDTGQPLSTAYKFGHIVSEVENVFGRQPTSYLSKLVNDQLIKFEGIEEKPKAVRKKRATKKKVI